MTRQRSRSIIGTARSAALLVQHYSSLKEEQTSAMSFEFRLQTEPALPNQPALLLGTWNRKRRGGGDLSGFVRCRLNAYRLAGRAGVVTCSRHRNRHHRAFIPGVGFECLPGDLEPKIFGNRNTQHELTADFLLRARQNNVAQLQ